MGQKINPLGFRLGTTQSHHSLWFEQLKNYCEGLQEDQKIRDFIKNYIQKNMRISSGAERIAHIEIQKRIDLIQIIIFIGFPKLLIESRPRGIEELQMNPQKEFHYVSRKLNIAITRIVKPYENPNIIAEFIAGQLKNRVSFRKAMKKAIELTEQAETKGIQVQITGGIDIKEITRLNRLEKVRLHYKLFRLKLIIFHIQSRYLWGIRHQNLEFYRQ